MKKILSLLIVMLMAPFVVQAATDGVSINVTTVNITVGKSATVAITATNSAGNVLIKTDNANIAKPGVSSMWLENSTSYLTITGVSEGTTNITILLDDISTFDEVKLSGSRTIKVVVSKAITTSTTTKTTTTTKSTTKTTTRTYPTTKKVTTTRAYPTTAKVTTTTKQQTTTKAKTTIKANMGTTTTTTTTTVPITTTIPVIGDPKVEETTTEAITNERRLYLNSLDIVGYNINFDKNTFTYNIKVDQEVTKLYITAETDLADTYIQNIGAVDIQGVTKLKITVIDKTNGNKKDYDINLNRMDCNYVNEVSPKVDDGEEIFTVTNILVGGLTFSTGVLAVALIASNRRKHKFYN